MNRRVRAVKQQERTFRARNFLHDGAWVVVDCERMLMLRSYEYLGLLGHPQLKQTAHTALESYGTGHHGARLLTGTTTVHLNWRRSSLLHRADGAILFSSGYVANLSTISTLVAPGDCVIGDQWNHASITDGCRMSGAQFLEFRHNDMESLASNLQLRGAADPGRGGRGVQHGR